MKEKIQGALIGGAIGDAIGFLIEKSPRKEAIEFSNLLLKEQFLVKNRTYPKVYEFGQYSDDTQFSKLLIESFLKNISFKDLLIKEYQKDSLIGLGKNTKRLLNLFLKNEQVPRNYTENISNGSVMRSWPVGILFSCPILISQKSKEHSQLTHNTEEAIKSCEFIASTMNYLLTTPQVVVDDIINLAPDSIKTLIKSCLNESQGSIVEKLKDSRVSGWEGIVPLAIPTTTAAVVSFLNTLPQDFNTALSYGLSLGGDTDSVASVLGALKGAQVGIDSINPFLRNIIHDQGQFKEDYFLQLSSSMEIFRKTQKVSI